MLYLIYDISQSIPSFFLTSVLAVGNGSKALNNLYNTRVTRVIYHSCWFYIGCNTDTIYTGLMLSDVFQDYTLEGEFGTATDDFSHTGRIVERSTYGRIT